MAQRRKKAKPTKKQSKYNFAKQEEGSSCHYCKKKMDVSLMMRCIVGQDTTPNHQKKDVNSKKRERPCGKKYCRRCLKMFYPDHKPTDGKFVCPSCLETCRCAACRRRQAKKRMKTDKFRLKNEAVEEVAVVLESSSYEGAKVEIGQVHGLLEIMEARPDIQSIVKRAMKMKFDDENSKILYVGHLIDQALTRPDMLALYYKRKHGNSKFDDR